MSENRIPLKQWTDAELDKLAEEMALNVERMNAASENDVVRALIDAGMPAKDAAQQMKMPGLATFARQFYLDTLDAALGNPEAKARVEKCREAWGKMTRRRLEQA